MKLVFILLLISITGYSKIRNLQTTRLLSTAGAGVGSILVNETAFLNPAPIVFVPSSSAYYQAGQAEFRNENPNRNRKLSDGTSQVYLAADAHSNLKGSLSYQDHSENSQRRQRLTSSVASAITKNLSMGLLYKYTKEDQINCDCFDSKDEEYNELLAGFTYIPHKDISLGLTFDDVFKARPDESLVTFGLNYRLVKRLQLIIDLGSSYREDFSANNFSRAAAQVLLFDSLYVRYGLFRDNHLKHEGTGWGFSWIGPKLSFEYATKITEVYEDNDDMYEEEKFIDTSISVAFKFK